MGLDVEIHLDIMDIRKTIKEENTTSNQKVKVMIFLHYHLHQGFKI